MKELEQAVVKSKTFIPKKYVGNNQKMLGIIEKFIEENVN